MSFPLPRSRRTRRWMSVVLALLILAVSALHPRYVAAIAQGFTASDTTSVGALVSLKQSTPNAIELANTDRVGQMLGIVSDNSLIELSDGTKQVQVVTSDVTLGLVSDINGDIKTGDKITASPLDGIGMKATTGTQIVGIAGADLASVQTKTQTIENKAGKQQIVRIGSVPIQVNVTYYQGPQLAVSVLPTFLQNLADKVAGHEVAVVRILLAAVILLLAFVSIAMLLYSAVRSSIISIGRNPLSEIAVRKSLLQVGITIIAILLITLSAIYLILIT